MLHKTRGIVLKSTKYGESSLIVHILTEKFGLQSYMVNGVRSSKSKVHAGMFQPLHLLQLISYHKETTEIQRFKEARNQPAFTSIPFHLGKSSISLFLAEMIYKTVRQQEFDQQLFDFIYNSIELLDAQDSPVNNFHLLFLIALSKYLGFYPGTPLGLERQYFDLKSGTFVSSAPLHLQYVDDALSKQFIVLLQTGFDRQENLSIRNSERRALLEKLLAYYSIHLDGMGSIHAHLVLQEVLDQ